MMKSTNYKGIARLAVLFVLWLLVFAVGKIAFMLLCAPADESLSLGDMLAVQRHGLAMDHSMSAYLITAPWLASLLCVAWPRLRPRLRIPYYIYSSLAALIVVTGIIVDISLYPFWQYKLDFTVLAYLDSPREAMASVSWGFILVRVLVAVALMAAITWAAVKVMAGKAGKDDKTGSQNRIWQAVMHVVMGGLLFMAMRGGITESTMNVGNAYFSNRQFLNHAAVNPVFSFMSSMQRNEQYDQMYRAMSEDEAWTLVHSVYGFDGRSNQGNNSSIGNSNSISCNDSTNVAALSQPRLLAEGVQRPSILLILWESLPGQMTAEIGGRAGIVPTIDSLSRTALYFSEYRVNSYRTDRGMLCALSGHLSFPQHSLMKMAARCQHLPSLARTLKSQGYSTTFAYGGDINFTNMKGYLMATGYDTVLADSDFPLDERSSSKWGAADEYLFRRVASDIKRLHASGQPFFYTTLTLSSHEPWDVPGETTPKGLSENELMHRSFGYTDRCLGQLLHELRQSPVWNNLLVIITPDHGCASDDVTSRNDPRFFHVPMVWTGGAVESPRRVETLMNQSDLPATLLGQMGMDHNDFPWSRDVMAASYTSPFTYSVFNDGFVLTDSLGITVWDNTASRIIQSSGDGVEARRRLGQAILQCSYDQLETLH